MARWARASLSRADWISTAALAVTAGLADARSTALCADPSSAFGAFLLLAQAPSARAVRTMAPNRAVREIKAEEADGMKFFSKSGRRSRSNRGARDGRGPCMNASHASP